MKAAINLGKDVREEFGNPPEYEIRECRECVWYYSKKLIQEQSAVILNVECLRYSSSSWERDEYWQMIRRSSRQRQEYLSTLILFYVLVRRNKVQEQQKSGKANLKALRCILHIKMQWESMEKQLDSSGKKSQIFQYCPFFKRSRKTWYRRTPNRRNRIIFVSMFNDILWKSDDRNCITNAERMSRITRSSSFQDTGRFLVQAQRRCGTEVLTINRDSGISQKIRWYNNSKKQDTLFSQASVLWIEEFSNEDKTKVPFTSTGNPRTRNSFFRRCILQLSSVSTEQRRTGVLSSAWRLKRKDQNAVLMNSKVLIVVESAEVEWFTANSSTWKQGAGTHQFSCSGEQKFKWHRCVKRVPSSICFLLENTTRYNLDGKDGWREITFLCCEYTISRAFKESEVRLS